MFIKLERVVHSTINRMLAKFAAGIACKLKQRDNRVSGKADIMLFHGLRMTKLCYFPKAYCCGKIIIIVLIYIIVRQ